MTCSPVLFSSDVKSVLRGRGYAVIHNPGSYKRLVVAYEEKGEELTAVTVHTVTKRQVQARIQRQRWGPKGNRRDQ